MKMRACGLTLVEIVVTLVILTATLFAMTRIMISFARTSSNLTKNEASLLGAAAAFEDIIAKITAAKQISYPTASVASNCVAGVTACSIEVRVAPYGSGADVYHYYWQSGNSTTQNNQLMYGSREGSSGAPTTTSVLVRNLSKLSFGLPAFLPMGSAPKNIVQVDLEAQHRDANDNFKKSPKETLSTIAVARARGSQ